MASGGALLIACLEAQGVDRVFCVPGESYLDALDALGASPIDLVVARQEGGAAMMAEADAKLTGRPGICFVTRGPGATNASAGVHVARQDGTPMILFVGQVARGDQRRDAFQEVDYRAMFGAGAEGGLAKAVEQVEDAARLPEVVCRAFAAALNGRPGPVVVALPEDVLSAETQARPGPRIERAEAGPTPAQIARLGELLAEAERPFAVLGGSVWDAPAVAAMRRFAEAHDLPVGCSFRRQRLFDHRHPNYAGDVGLGINPALRDRIAQSDLLLLIGARLSENPSQGFSLLDIPDPGRALVHIHPGPEEIGRLYAPTLGVPAAPGAFLAAADALAPTGRGEGRALAAHQAYLAWSASPEPAAKAQGVALGAVIAMLGAAAPDAIIANGAGNYAAWIHRYWRFSDFEAQIAPTSGSMGYGLPGAIAAKLRRPAREVVCFAGDGCFQMTAQEFATAVQCGAAVIVLVADNGMYGTIRMHQERRYPGRVVGTALTNPDFAAFARACGGFGETVARTADFPEALARARAAGAPALLHLKTDPLQIAPGQRLTAEGS